MRYESHVDKNNEMQKEEGRYLSPYENDKIFKMMIYFYSYMCLIQHQLRLGWESALQALSTSQRQQQSEPKSNGNYSNDQDLLVKMDAR